MQFALLKSSQSYWPRPSTGNPNPLKHTESQSNAIPKSHFRIGRLMFLNRLLVKTHKWPSIFLKWPRGTRPFQKWPPTSRDIYILLFLFLFYLCCYYYFPLLLKGIYHYRTYFLIFRALKRMAGAASVSRTLVSDFKALGRRLRPLPLLCQVGRSWPLTHLGFSLLRPEGLPGRARTPLHWKVLDVNRSLVGGSSR